MLWNTLPDELIHEILVLHFARVPEAFCGDPTENLPPLERQRAREMVPKCPPSGALLVSKSWLRVGTPLLYEFLSLSKPKHTQRVAALFRAHPTLGNYVRHVRLRGGLVEQLGDILGAAPNVESLSVSLKLRPRDNIDGLLRVIPALNPSVLYLRIPWEMSKSHQNVAELRATIETAIATHIHLQRTLYLFQYSGVPATLLDAIHESPSLEEISINGRDVVSWLSRRWLHSVARNERISRIVYRGEDPDIRQRQRVADNFRVPPEMLELLEMVEDPPAEPWTEQPMRPIRRR